MRFLLIAFVVLLGCGPFLLLPGGELGGPASDSAVADWATKDECGIELETRPQDPYSINIWAAGAGPRLYLAAGRGGESNWVKHIQADPDVRVRACGTVYEMRATHTKDPVDVEAFLTSVERKHGWKRDEASEYRDWVFRLESR